MRGSVVSDARNTVSLTRCCSFTKRPPPMIAIGTGDVDILSVRVLQQRLEETRPDRQLLSEDLQDCVPRMQVYRYTDEKKKTSPVFG